MQHLALFVPWQLFLTEESDDINRIWDREKQALPRRLQFYVDNIQLLRKSAEDAKRDAKQWASMSGDGDATVTGIDLDDADKDQDATFQSDEASQIKRLADVLNLAIGRNEATKGSKEIGAMIQKLCQFELSFSSREDLQSKVIIDQTSTATGMQTPLQEQVKSIKSQQASVSREREDDPRDTRTAKFRHT